MGSSPKQADYKASAAEQASASVALAEYNNFKKKYDPLLQQMRDQSKTDDVTDTLRGRANADTMQALTTDTAYRNTQANDLSSDMSKAYQGQLGVANRSGKDIQNKMQTSVLGTARGQAADAQTGMAQASRLGTSQALARAKAKQEVRSAKNKALGQVASAAMVYGAEKGMFGEKGTPGSSTTGTDGTITTTQGTPDSFGYKLASGLFGGGL
jgi:hypothetical protein